jgi:hypothetical protein
MAILLAQAGPKGVEDRVFGQIQELRPQAWPNSLMIGLADELLGRKGRLSAALGRFYARQIRNQPGTEQVMQSCGRGPEIEMARAFVVNIVVPPHHKLRRSALELTGAGYATLTPR